MKKFLLIFYIIIAFYSFCFANIPYSMKKSDQSGKKAKLITTYPVFIGNSELIEFANKNIYLTIKNHIETNKTFISEYGDKEDYISTAIATVVRADSKIISVVWKGDWMAGGVHNDIIYTATFGIKNGKPKMLNINDIGDPKYYAEKIIEHYRLSLVRPQMLDEGKLTSNALLNEAGQDLLNSFTVSDNYIAFYRKEYQFGYGFEGSDFVKIPLKY